MLRMSEVDEAALAAALRCLEAPCKGISLSTPTLPGVYAVYIREPGKLAPVLEGIDDLIYIGLSTNLASREFDMHFSSNSTGVSTLRRSIGALLKGPLDLHAFPRSSGPSETNFRNYCFEPDGEERLTAWMREQLQVGVHATPLYEALETALVRQLKPPLNLTKWPNPYAAEIKRLRKVCADEARASRKVRTK